MSGSSKGFGKAVALSFAKNLTIPVHFVLSGWIIFLWIKLKGGHNNRIIVF